jgi:ubiquinone biosynthesis protein UbiJ
MKPKKKFSCVEMQDRAALRIYEETKSMTREEELAYWAKKTETLRKKQEALRAERAESGVLS